MSTPDAVRAALVALAGPDEGWSLNSLLRAVEAAREALAAQPAAPDADALFYAWNNAPSTKGWNDLDEWDKVEAAFRAGVAAGCWLRPGEEIVHRTAKRAC